MSKKPSTTAETGVLRATLQGLLSVANAAHPAARAREQTLADAIDDGEKWFHRRAAKNAVDRARYRVGAAFEPAGNLEQIDDVVLTGLDLLGATGLALLCAIMLEHGSDTLSDAICRLQKTRAGRIVRENGVWARRVWLATEYRAIVETFEASPAGQDPKARWRSDKPTMRQLFLALELARLHEVERPVFADGGAAHDWLRAMNGRFDILKPPPLPPTPTIADLTS